MEYVQEQTNKKDTLMLFIILFLEIVMYFFVMKNIRGGWRLDIMIGFGLFWFPGLIISIWGINKSKKIIKIKKSIIATFTLIMSIFSLPVPGIFIALTLSSFVEGKIEDAKDFFVITLVFCILIIGGVILISNLIHDKIVKK